MLPRLVATDCDGTLLRSDGTVSERTRTVLADVVAAGTDIMLVTARPPRWMPELADMLGIDGAALCMNGALRYDLRTGDLTCLAQIDEALGARLVEDIRAEVPGVSFAVESIRGFAREPGFERASGRHDGQWHVAEGAAVVAEAAGKLLVRHQRMHVDDLHAAVSTVVGDRAEVSHSGATGLAEIGPKGVTKGTALAQVCAASGIDASQVWAFGDMLNDLPMLRWAGRSFAVANAHAQVKAACSDAAPANDEDSVAQVLAAAIAAARPGATGPGTVEFGDIRLSGAGRTGPVPSP
ncbi:MAG: haloacid dehalogenase [Micrococcales bacterium]|nr:MAG: haloacid dehalogenase [Micrococcales bacterium]PIE26911.1 MAG: haloacid dehalogenase [Micrococcales bacterium]